MGEEHCTIISHFNLERIWVKICFEIEAPVIFGLCIH